MSNNNIQGIARSIESIRSLLRKASSEVMDDFHNRHQYSDQIEEIIEWYVKTAYDRSLILLEQLGLQNTYEKLEQFELATLTRRLSSATLYAYRIMRNIILALVVLGLIAGCGDKTYRLTNEQQVYEFVFNEIMQNPTKEVLILDVASVGGVRYDTSKELLKTFPILKEFPAKLLDEVLHSSDTNPQLIWKPILVNVKFIKNGKYFGGSAKDQLKNWLNFRKAYPDHGGYYSVSRVVYDRKSKEAVLVLSYSCKVLCGAHDSLLYLRKIGNKWKIIKVLRLSVS